MEEGKENDETGGVGVEEEGVRVGKKRGGTGKGRRKW